MRRSIQIVAKRVRGYYNDPRDAYQDAWVEALDALRSSDSPLLLYPILTTVVYRRIVDKHRRKRLTIAPIDPIFIIDEKHERALDADKRDLATLIARANLTALERETFGRYADCILKGEKMNFTPKERKIISYAKSKLRSVSGTAPESF